MWPLQAANMEILLKWHYLPNIWFWPVWNVVQEQHSICKPTNMGSDVCQLSSHLKWLRFNEQSRNPTAYNLWNSLQPCVPVFFWAAFMLFCGVWCCMQQRQRWLGVVLCLWSNASARAQYIWVWKMRTRKLSVRRGWSWAKGEDTGTQTHKYTPTGIHTYSGTELYHLLLSDWFWSIRFSEKETTLVGSCYAAHQFSDDIIQSETGLLYLVSGRVQWLRLHQHPYRDWHRQYLWVCGKGSVVACTGCHDLQIFLKKEEEHSPVLLTAVHHFPSISM